MDFLLITFLTLVNAVFAMSEMAVASSRRSRLQSQADEGLPGAQAALELMDKPTEFLSTVQVGITSIGILNGIVGEAAFSDDLALSLQELGMPVASTSYAATAIVVVVITFFTIVFGELVPKRIGQMFPEAVSRWMAPLMRGLSWLATPFVRVLAGTTAGVLKLLKLELGAGQRVTAEEVSASLDEAVGDGAIDAEEHKIVSNVFRLDNRPLTSFMTPSADAIWLDADATVDTAMQQVKNQPLHSWYPVVKGSMDNVVGVIALAELIQNPRRDQALEDLALAPLFLPETLSGLDLLTKLTELPAARGDQPRHGLSRLACVVDEYGVVQGLITPGDLLEAITGELSSNSQDSVIWAEMMDDGAWLLDGLMPLQEIKQRLALDLLPDEDQGHYNTLAGLILYVIGRLPTTGQMINWGGWRFEVTQMEGRRIATVLARKLPQSPPTTRRS